MSISKSIRTVALSAVALVFCLSSFAVSAEKQKSTSSGKGAPSEAYLNYVAAAAKATKLADLLPHLSKEYRAMLESRPKEDHNVWLGRLKESADIKGLKITKETISGKKCTLDATGISARGNAIKGKIILVKEGDGWKLDEAGWST